ncbi:DUF3005 domain-containing protein [Burkholderia lata]|uniref:2-oxoglutarate dehydrogenase n=1 Tax=Burkholderia lata (strain ATCC 17760 / DSM 23089 / LMG 22485 / NCIMB 9086 / R18194 / 383) TaxID=482957 RepID=A0A6P2SGL8_BURL3|nr:DUF3005 domain-containing protein [Burkholderia lata]VWC48255.1 2-oxoglutarate dehydrogenase [Burkholderia lata]
MQNPESNPDPKYRRDKEARRPTKAPAARRMPDAASGRPLTPEMIAAKTPTGLPPIERGTHAPDSGDPVRRAAARIPTLDNANMAMTDNTVDVDGKGMEAAAGASKWHDNVIYSNASLDEAVDTPDEGLGGIESRPSGNLPQIATRPGWHVRHVGAVDVEHGDGTRAEHVIVLERNN